MGMAGMVGMVVRGGAHVFLLEDVPSGELIYFLLKILVLFPRWDMLLP